MGTCAPRSAEVEFDCRKPLQIYGVCSTALRPGTEVSGRHLRAKVALPAGTRGGDVGCWKQLSAHVIVMGELGGLAGHGLVKEDLCSGLHAWSKGLRSSCMATAGV